MKKWILVALMFLLLILPACGNDDVVSDDDGQNEPVAEEPSNEEPDTEEPDVQEPDPVVIVAHYDELSEGISPLTGLPFDGDNWPAMVQIENTSAARPQSGISAAELFYEMEVEAKITRLTAFFQQKFPDKVGPVRSARRQHIIMWSEWNYLYAFYGGSKPAGQNIYDIRDREMGITATSLDGMGSEGSFFRSSDRRSPHNAYLKLSAHLDDAVKPDRVRTLYYEEDAVFEGTPAEIVSLAYTSKNQIRYEYDQELKLYKRFINGDPMVDKENGEQIAVTNIIIQRARHYKVEGTVYTNIEQFGSGEAIYFSNGAMKTGTWKRANKDELTVYYDENGEELCFPAGKTFIQIIRTDLKVTADVYETE